MKSKKEYAIKRTYSDGTICYTRLMTYESARMYLDSSRLKKAYATMLVRRSRNAENKEK